MCSSSQFTWVNLASPEVFIFVPMKNFVSEYKLVGAGDEIAFKFAVVLICCWLPHVERRVCASNHLQAFLALEVLKEGLLEERTL